MIYYVNPNTDTIQDGSFDHPFSAIQQAADIAMPGDEILVYPGIYREYVDPKNAGTEENRIVYRSLEPLQAVITGAESVKNWEKIGDGVWKVSIPNRFFKDHNPYTTLVSGDWFVPSLPVHTGDVYLNHKSLYEVTEEEKVHHPVKDGHSREEAFSDYVWYTEQKDDETVIIANFHEYDPNAEDVEISVRQDCFLPSKEGIGFITLSGFTIREAATQWAPPTAYQDGMVGPHWSKGWIIEDCEIYESKCSGISIGKYYQKDNDNKWLHRKYKDGTQTEREVICEASYDTWNKENVGSHIIRRNVIHDCGQTGIVGHLGGIFSIIEDNHIYDINKKRNLNGAEIGGIKMHAAIDTVIRNNHIHHCTRGLWLDWQAQGTRVTGNLFHHNCTHADLTKVGLKDIMNVLPEIGEDLFIEVSHGPTLVDNNYLLSERSVKLAAQGVAFVKNLFAGSLTAVGTGTDNGTRKNPSPRYTPYHVPHGTNIAGFMTILHGDCRFYNNLFVQSPVSDTLLNFHKVVKAAGKLDPRANGWDTMNFASGTFPFDDYPTEEEWKKQFEGYCGMNSGKNEIYYDHLPVWTGGNHFFNGSRPCKKEKNFHEEKKIRISLSVTKEKDVIPYLIEKDGWKVYSDIGSFLREDLFVRVNSDILGCAFEPEMRFETPEGEDIEL